MTNTSNRNRSGSSAGRRPEAAVREREQRRFAAASAVCDAAGAAVQAAHLVLRWLAAGKAPFQPALRPVRVRVKTMERKGNV